jgi:hypothetical protein
MVSRRCDAISRTPVAPLMRFRGWLVSEGQRSEGSRPYMDHALRGRWLFLCLERSSHIIPNQSFLGRLATDKSHLTV